jgi:hypothetical protein
MTPPQDCSATLLLMLPQPTVQAHLFMNAIPDPSLSFLTAPALSPPDSLICVDNLLTNVCLLLALCQIHLSKVEL